MFLLAVVCKNFSCQGSWGSWLALEISFWGSWLVSQCSLGFRVKNCYLQIKADFQSFQLSFVINTTWLFSGIFHAGSRPASATDTPHTRRLHALHLFQPNNWSLPPIRFKKTHTLSFSRSHTHTLDAWTASKSQSLSCSGMKTHTGVSGHVNVWGHMEEYEDTGVSGHIYRCMRTHI